MAVIGVRRKNRICVCKSVLDHPGLPPEPSPFAKRFSAFGQRVGVIAMKTLLSSLALALALGFAMPPHCWDVTTAKNAADCEKAGGAWDAAKNACSEKDVGTVPCLNN